MSPPGGRIIGEGIGSVKKRKEGTGRRREVLTSPGPGTIIAPLESTPRAHSARVHRQENSPVPLYEYQCGKCGHRFEKIQKLADPPVKICPKCGGKVKKLPSAPAIQFKGSGWYITDYARKSSPSSEEKADKPSESKEKPASEKKGTPPKKKDSGD
jgi:putative FmdB family regulatory protein